VAVVARSPSLSPEGLTAFLARYDPPDPSAQLSTIVRALGYLDDVDPDELLPIPRDEIVRYWQRRQPEVLKALGRLTDGGVLPPAPRDAVR
jgi:hypothetical protein